MIKFALATLYFPRPIYDLLCLDECLFFQSF